jgi:hypothetical protein
MKTKLPASYRLLTLLAAVACDVRPQHREQIAELQTELDNEALDGEPVAIKPARAAKPAAKPATPEPAAK